MDTRASCEPNPALAVQGQRVVVTINGERVLGLVGETLLEAAERAGGLLDSQCLAGACGTCMVRVVAGADLLCPLEPAEEILLEPEEKLENKRLACQARLRGDVSVVSSIDS